MNQNELLEVGKFFWKKENQMEYLADKFANSENDYLKNPIQG